MDQQRDSTEEKVKNKNYQGITKLRPPEDVLRLESDFQNQTIMISRENKRQ